MGIQELHLKVESAPVLHELLVTLVGASAHSHCFLYTTSAMGNDGGSIPTRRELVKEAAKDPSTTQVKETQTEKLQYYWAHCALSQKPLSLPIVSDSTGNLYNKDAILEHLISTNKSGQEDNVASNERTSGTIRSLRDVVEVGFKVEEEDGGIEKKSTELRLVCPVSGKTLGPGVKAVYLVPCGHAFAESTVKEMAGDQCLEVSLFIPYASDNRLILSLVRCPIFSGQHDSYFALFNHGKGSTSGARVKITVDGSGAFTEKGSGLRKEEEERQGSKRRRDTRHNQKNRRL